MEVFPYIGYYGSTARHAYRATEREYDNGDYRRYVRSNFNHREITLVFEDIAQDERDAITEFFNARMSSTDDFEFTVYVFEETSAGQFSNGGIVYEVDISALEETGQHKARFPSDFLLEWTLSGSCSWDTSLTIKLLD
ncbi:MAG TPA: hypothetical protein VJ464_15820 [Blastocatellia bacterium]|nr:hypothetical protein [Blastocatellia bacterium]